MRKTMGYEPSTEEKAARAKVSSLAASLTIVLIVAALGCRDQSASNDSNAPSEKAPANVSVSTTSADDSEAESPETVAALQAEELAQAHRLLETFPSNPRVLNALGHIYNNQGDRTQAVSYWRQVVALEPGNAAAYDAMAKVAFLKEENDEAARLWQRVLEIAPGAPGVHHQLAMALMGAGRLAEAAEALAREIEINPKASLSHTMLGEVHRMLEDYDRAIESFQAAVQIDPNATKACYGLSVVYRAIGEKEQSQRWMTEFRRLKAADVQVDHNRRDAYDDVGVTRKTIAETFTEMGRIYARHNDLENAERLWLRAAHLDTKQLLCRQDLGQLYQRTNRIDRAIAMCEQLAQLEPDNADYLVNAGVFHARLKQYDAAIDALVGANALDPKRPANYRTLARLYLETGRDADQAVAHAETAVRLQPNAASFFVLGAARQRQGDRAAALAAYRRAAELEPGNRRYQTACRNLQGQTR